MPLTLKFILSFVFGVVFAEPKPVEALMNKLPSTLVQVHREGTELVVKRGKCCSHAPTHSFSSGVSGWLLSSSMGGGEGSQFVVVDASWVKDELKIVYRDTSNKTTRDLVFFLTRDPSRAGLFRSKRDPLFDNLPTMWIDEKERSKLKVILQDDCPPEGEAC